MRLRLALAVLGIALAAPSFAEAQVGFTYPCNSRSAALYSSLAQDIREGERFGLAVAAGYGAQSASQLIATGIQATVLPQGPAPQLENIINVTITGGIIDAGPHADTCGYVEVGPLPQGGYRVNVLLDVRSPLAPLTSPASGAYLGVLRFVDNRFGRTPSVVVRPIQPIQSMPIQVDVPVISCSFGDPKYVVTGSSVVVNGNKIDIRVDQGQSLCFGGDPPIAKAFTITLPPLAAGTYSLEYRRFLQTDYLSDFLLDLETKEFVVAAGPADIPTLSVYALVALSLLVCAATMAYKQST